MMSATTFARSGMLAAALLATAPTLAFADGHNALVLHSDGNADPATHARVDALILRLAKQGGLTATAGDITFADAAAATGCKPEVATCRDDVGAMLGTDELITATTYVSGSELKVVVRRGPKGAPPREATATIAMIDSSDAGLEAGLAALFGVTVAAPPPRVAVVTQPPVTHVEPPPTTPLTPEQQAPLEQQPLPQPQPPPIDQPPPSDEVAPHHTLKVIGATYGVVGVVLGMVLWGAAKSTENQIAMAPTATSTDLKNLQALESKGDGQAGGGNVFFITGLVVGGVSAYYLYRDHRHAAASRHAMITPMLVEHGGGIALSFGGTP
jgi:hypothetical protein